MQAFLLFLAVFATNSLLHSQEAGSLVAFDIREPYGDEIVSSHKDLVHLTLVIDSVVRFDQTYKLNWKRELDVKEETDYLQVANDLYIKIFISRNLEYGKKFYSWRWDYLKKEGMQYHQLGGTEYRRISFNSDQQIKGSSWGQGIGVDNEPDYLMFYYRSKLQ